MEARSISAINQEVYRRFPELKGVKPRLQKIDRNTLLLYQAEINLPEQKSLHRSVRVVVNERGEILKMSTSR
jgi:hypothetical protein